MGEFPRLQTKRLHLVQIDHRYKDELFEILSMDEVTRYYGKDNLVDTEEASELIDHFYRLFHEKRSIRWGIIWKENNQFLGTVGLNNLNLWNKKAEIGYELHPTYWRRGITLEAVIKVLDYGYHDLDLYRIGALTFPQNIASNELLRKLGFKQEGTLRGYLHQNYKAHDALVHSLLRPEWIGKRRRFIRFRDRFHIGSF
ncbi:GNAT family N-acetyltransferase [Oceanobacillus senegalensis]|uniref:GNAT family N-acetyltransferase n=1 Tax=Oceanobacillus senegalensis TaxID=1936063 RepID=UPI000A30AFCF|nr:GNAT family N-acetyltransferase [Oceanobacillus senegalensis]